MPRGRRLDAPGLIHHVMLRGIERRRIFFDDEDRRDFLARLARLLRDERVACLAWCLMPNHVHLLLRSEEARLSRFMARLGTGYARRFNERHDRVGHLFQNRFRSDRVTDEGHLQALVRYIHRNPLDAGLVPSLEALETHPWTGHPALLGRAPRGFQEVGEVLARFGGEPGRARSALREWMADPLPDGPRRRPPEAGIEPLVRWVCGRLGMDPAALRGRCRTRRAVRARSLVAFLARERLGLGAVEISQALGMDASAVRRAFERGHREAGAWGLTEPPREFP